MHENIRVAIVDDHEAIRGGIAAILGADDRITIVGEAENGLDAAALCLRERITAETTTRVLVLTTFDSDDLVAQALAAGAHGYLLKTVRGAELIQAIAHVAADRHVIDPAVAGGVIARLNSATPAPPPRTDLTDREAQVLGFVSEGLTNQQIADRLTVSITTVKTHVGSLYAKTGATSRVQLGRHRAS